MSVMGPTPDTVVWSPLPVRQAIKASKSRMAISQIATEFNVCQALPGWRTMKCDLTDLYKPISDQDERFKSTVALVLPLLGPSLDKVVSRLPGGRLPVAQLPDLAVQCFGALQEYVVV
jgi:hypothetical protein